MNPAIALVLSLSAAYLIGAIPTSFLMARILKGVDIRQHGSKNVGATNVYRVVGKLPGFITLMIDILKGIFVVTVLVGFFSRFIGLDYGFYRVLLGAAAITGHIWPVYLGFKGGKGVAATIGVMSVLAPIVLLLSLGVWLMVFFLKKYVSLSSLAMGVSFPLFSIILFKPFYLVLFTVLLCALNTYKHKDNIKRLLRGEENRVNVKI